MFRNILKIFLLLIFSSCYERIVFDVTPDRDMLVVYGELTNQKKNHSVTVWYAVDYTREFFRWPAYQNPIESANVYIESGDGRKYEFAPNPDFKGEYISEEEFSGEVGNTYRLHVIIDDERSFISEWEEIPEVVPIDSLSLEKVTGSELRNGIELTTRGVDVNLFSRDIPGEENYFKYRWEGVFYLYKSGCWVYDTDRDEVNTGSVHVEDGSEFAHFITHIPINSKRLGSSAYILTVEQHSITKKAFQYYNAILRNRSTGTIFSPTPVKLPTNIYAEGNSEALVGGFFSVSSVDHKRVDASVVIMVNYNHSCYVNGYPTCASCGRFSTTTAPEWW